MGSNMEMNNMSENIVGLFRAHITPIERIVYTTVGREDMLDDILKKLRTGATKKSVQHFVFIGPRGIGKTHFLTLIENAVNIDKSLSSRYTVIRFPEENHRILSFADFLMEIVQFLSEKTGDEQWGILHESQSGNINDQIIIDTVIPKLQQNHRQNGLMLLVMVENLDALLTQQIKDQQDIHRLRSFLMDSPCITLVATSPVYFPKLYDHKSPLFDFFDIQVLDDLSEEQTVSLIRQNLLWEKREALLKDFEALIPKIKALHIMTGGNPRLIMMLYELIASENILDVKAQFQKLLDRISPFYQDRLKELAPQERALLETIALMRSEPKTPASISQRFRKSTQLTSSLLKRMTGAGYLSVMENPEDKRSRLYRIKEGFFDLWLAMSESRQNKKRLPYLVDFFRIFFQKLSERENKREQLIGNCTSPECIEKRKENDFELLDYLSELGDTSEKLIEKTRLAAMNLNEGRIANALEYIREIEPMSPVRGIFRWIRSDTDFLAAEKEHQDISKWLQELIEYWKIQRSGDLEKAAEIAQSLGYDLSAHGLQAIRIELLKDALSQTNNTKQKYSLLIDIAQSQQTAGQTEAALESFQKALQMCRDEQNKEYEAIILRLMGQIHYIKSDYAIALNNLKRSLTICREIGNKNREGATLNDISQIFKARGDYDTAFKYLEKSLAITQEIGNKSGEGTTLNNIGGIYYKRGDYNAALDYIKKSLAINKEIGDKSSEMTTLHNIAMIAYNKKDWKQYVQYETTAYSLAIEISDAEGMYNVGKILGEVLCSAEQKKQGLAILQRAYTIGLQAGYPDVDKVKEILEKYK